MVSEKMFDLADRLKELRDANVNTTSEVRQIWCTFLVKNYTSSCEKGRFGV